MRRSSDAIRTLGMALLIAVVLSTLNVLPVHSQAAILIAHRWTTVPTDPLDPAWDRVAPLDVPLSAQHITLPGGGSVFSVQVRALQDGRTLAIQLSWQDATRNGAALRPQEFRDAAAVQFPLQPTALPFYCMGQRGNAINIWHWKADWQDDLDRYQDVQAAYPNGGCEDYPQDRDPVFIAARSVGNPFAQVVRPSPVENLLAGGFGTLTSVPEQRVQGRGIWQNGRWTVVFVRELEAKGPDEAPIPVGGTTSIAFAVWDGAFGDRDGQKATSTWLTFQVEGEPTGGPLSPTLGFLLFVAGGATVTIALWVIMPGRRSAQA